MRPLLFILTFLFILASCENTSEEVKKSTTENNNAPSSSKDTIIADAITPSLIKVKTIDTLILDKYLISIIEKPLKTSIINVAEGDDAYYGKRFNNSEYFVRVTKGEIVLLDTVFNKDLFKDSLNQEFYDHSLLTNYRLVDYDDKLIEFNGSIAIPNTDWALDFQHIFHLKTKKMEYKPIVEDDFE